MGEFLCSDVLDWSGVIVLIAVQYPELLKKIREEQARNRAAKTLQVSNSEH